MPPMKRISPDARRLASSAAGGAHPVVDEHHVEVAGVGQLGAAEAPHPEHGEADRRLEGGERALQRGLRQKGEVGADPTDIGVAEEVACGDPEEVAAVPAPEALLTVAAVRAPLHRLVGRLQQRLAWSGEEAGRAGRGGPRGRGCAAASHRGGGSSRRSCTGCAPWPVSRGTIRPGYGCGCRCRGGCARRGGPRSGSGDWESQSSSSGSSCCMSRLDRFRPRVSSRTAAWVRFASMKPKALNRAAAASGDKAASAGAVSAKASSSGRKYTRSWMTRTPSCVRRSARVSCSLADASARSRRPITRARWSSAAASYGMAWSCCSATSWTRCSTVRRNR